MARNFAVKKVRKQMYPATYTFKDDVDGAIPDGWVPEAGSVTIISDFVSHRKILKSYHDGVDMPQTYNNFSSSQPNGTIEFWIGTDDDTKLQAIYLMDDLDGGIAANLILIEVSFSGGILRMGYGTGAGIGYRTTAYTNNTIRHIKITFDCTTDKYSGWVDGVLLVDDENFYDDNTLNNAQKLHIVNWAGVSNTYYDAFGYSWDTDYNIGDNVHWRHYKDQDSDFESEDVGTTSDTIDWVDTDNSGANCDVEIIAEYNEHKKILELYDNNGATRIDLINSFASGQITGTIEYWIKNDGGGLCHVYFRGGGTACSYVTMHDTANNWGYLNAGWAFVAFSNSPTWVVDTWYHVKFIFSCTTDTYTVYIDNVIAEADVAFRAVVATLDDMDIQTDNADNGYYVYLDAISYSWTSGNEVADNRIFDYNDSYTREDITTLVKNVITSNILHGWRNGTLYSETVYYYDEVFFQIYDVNSKLGMEADLTNRIQHDSLYHYPLQDKNADDLVNESSNTFDTKKIHDPTDSTSILKVILPNVSEADGDLILVDADTKTDTYSPVTKNYPDYMLLRDISDLSDSVVIIAADGKCYLDDDKDSGDVLDLDTAADKLIMTRPPIPNDIVGVNYFVIKGAMNPDAGIRFFKVVDNSGSDKKNTFRITNNQLRSQTDVDAYAAKIAAKLIAIKEISIDTQGLGAHNMGETFNYKYVNSVHNIPQKDYYIIREDMDYDLATATIVLSEGLVEKSKYAQRFERAEDFSDSDMSEIYETDIITFDLNLIPYLGASDHGFGVDTIKGEYCYAWFYISSNIDEARDITIDFIFKNGVHGARTTDGLLLVAKYPVDGDFTSTIIDANIGFDGIFGEDGGYYRNTHTIASSDVTSDYLYLLQWVNNETDNGNATTMYVTNISITYYIKRSL